MPPGRDRMPPQGDGRLVVVTTPIGNLDDLSPRAAEALRTAAVVLAEDTRRTGRLLRHVGSDAPQLAYHDHNARDRLDQIVDRVAQGQIVALVTDAGTPAVSDPGFRAVRACAEAGLAVEAVPGPSAVLCALVVSGLPTDRFVFEGFLPRSGSERRDRLDALAREQRTMVLFVAPHRAARDLADLSEALGDRRPAALCRELTKLHEEVVRGGLGELAARTGDHEPRGEVTLVVAGAPDRPQIADTPQALVEEVRLRIAAGLTKKEAIAEVAVDADVPKRSVYQAVVDAGG